MTLTKQETDEIKYLDKMDRFVKDHTKMKLEDDSLSSADTIILSKFILRCIALETPMIAKVMATELGFVQVNGKYVFRFESNYKL